MWVFGYGSLMWDGWENCFNGTKREGVKLRDYHREFNKSSIRNWGTKKNPGPTLGLEREADAECVGCAFEFDDQYEECIRYYLKGREGSAFELREEPLTLEDSSVVMAIVPVNRTNHSSYIGDVSIEERARMAGKAEGESGRCSDYINKVYEKLSALGIEDEYVKRMWKALQQHI